MINKFDNTDMPYLTTKYTYSVHSFTCASLEAYGFLRPFSAY